MGGGYVDNSNSIILTPNNGTVLPSDISVTPIYNGENQPTLTCNVNRPSFSTSATITGSNLLCSTATYSVNNLPSSISVSSWSVLPPNIAHISENGNQATLTATGNGTITISATLTNSCGQTATIEKNNIYVGRPDVSDASLKTQWPYQIETNTVSKVVGTKSFPGNFIYHWKITPRQSDCDQAHFPIPGQPGQSTNSITTNDNGVIVFWGSSCGGGYKIECWVENSCGQSYVGEVTVQVKYIDCIEVNISPNPGQSGPYQPKSLSLKLLSPCDHGGSIGGGGGGIGTPIYVKIFGISGNLEYQGQYKNTKITLTDLDLKAGTHIVTVQTANGFRGNAILVLK